MAKSARVSMHNHPDFLAFPSLTATTTISGTSGTLGALCAMRCVTAIIAAPLLNWIRRQGSGRMVLCIVLTAFLFLWVPALAEAEVSDAANDGIADPSIATSLPHNGDPGGIRKWLSEKGILFRLIYTNDVLSNIAGGNRRGTVDQGLFEGRLTVDFERLVGWQGLSFYLNGFQIHNTGRMRRDYVGGINTIAAIEAAPTTRLSELWVEQSFFGEAASLRVGQLAADTIFFFSDLSCMFLQSDWPTIAAANLPSGGPAYPLSTPGARLKVDPSKGLSLLLGVFNGDPAGPGEGDEQIRNHHGLNFRVKDRPLIIGEAQFRYNQGKEDKALPGTLKVGGWTHLGEFEDQRFAEDGSSIADPEGSGVPARHRGNYGLYAIIDQQIYRLPGGSPESGIAAFGRVSVSPSDRNLISEYVDGGIVCTGLIPGRPDDRFGASMIYARFSDRVRGFDQDQIALGGQPGSVRGYEANLELTYVARIVPGWSVQPDFQYIFHPDGQPGRDAQVLGIRMNWQF